MNKKFVKLFINIALCFYLILSFSACGKSSKKVTIVCTGFPQYDWTLQILGSKKDNFDVVYLLNGGVDLHNFQPTVTDISAIKKCDLFIYVGGESDEWAENALRDAANKDMLTLALLVAVEAVEEEAVVGMEEDDEDEVEYDEHVWLSLRNAQLLVNAITEAICELDPDNQIDYRTNAAAYNTALLNLDGEYERAVDDAPGNTVLFADRFPFRYLVDDYGLNYYAAFKGCSAETEASFETVQFLIGKVNILNLKVILVLETSDKALAQTVRSNSAAKNQTILVMHSCQSVTAGNIADGTTYLSVMTDNLDVLRQALS
jgi:zinc transport system substrate-binding protein